MSISAPVSIWDDGGAADSCPDHNPGKEQRKMFK